uniref:T9SS type A sorting domain-containing protein n=1 Tax=candidate division WOR-3 bacterium TaxID=2052148 RepID=A0A7C4U7Y1_UNCW3
MCKRLLSCFFIILLSLTGFGNNLTGLRELPVIYNHSGEKSITLTAKAGWIEICHQDFEGDYTGWNYVDGNSDGIHWLVGTTTDLPPYTPPNYGTRYAFYSDDDAGHGVVNTNEEWISPAFSIFPGSDSLKLIYGYGFYRFEAGEIFRTDVRFFSSGVWGPWATIQTYTASGSGTETIDLTPNLPADSVQVRWVYNDEASSSHWGFACGVDNVIISAKAGPSITAVTPANGSTDVPNDASITAKFDSPMKPSTINSDNVYLRIFTPGPGGGAYSRKISGTVSYNPDDSTVTFIPTGLFLADSQRYYMTISGNVQDTNGVPMVSDYTWSWTTVKNPHSPDAPYISNVRMKDGLKGWRIHSVQGTAASNPNTIEIIDDGGNYRVHIVRDNTGGDGGVLGIYQEINSNVGPVSYLYLSADINIVSGIPDKGCKIMVHTNKGDWSRTITTTGWQRVRSSNLIEALNLTPNDTIYYVWIGSDLWYWGFEIYVDNVTLSFIKDGHCRVLLLNNEGDFTELRNGLMEFGDVESVNYFNGHDSVPTVSELMNYDAVIVNDGAYEWVNNIAIGDTLMAFVDRGGGIVMGGICWDPQPGGTYGSGGLNGGIMDPSYNPYTKGTGSMNETWTLGWYDPYHPIMWDVASFAGWVVDSVTLSPWADTVAKFSGRNSGIATLQHLVGIPSYWGRQLLPYYPSGDFYELIHNAVNWSIHPFINGDFSLGKLGWTFKEGHNPPNPAANFEIYLTGGTPERALRIYRSSTSDGGYGEMSQLYKEDVSGWTNVTLSFWVRIDNQELTGDLAQYKEYPARVRVRYETSSGDTASYWKYFYLSASNVDPGAEQLSQGVWYLRQYDLRTAKLDIRKILGIYLSSAGWGFDASFGDVEIVNSPVGVEENTINKITMEVRKSVFGDEGEIRYTIPRDGEVRINVLNITGQVVKELVNGRMNKGSYRVVWDGKDNGGKELPKGVYFVRMESGKEVISKKILFVK